MADTDLATQGAKAAPVAPTASRANWMKSLWLHFGSDRASNPFGDIPLNQLPIPGSHDSGTFDMTRMAKTQGLSVAQQLEAGIRFFDLRPKVDQSVFKVHHGVGSGSEESGHILARCDANGKPVADPAVDCVFNDVRKFLIANPDEIIILKFQSFGAGVGQDFTPQDHRDFRALMAGYMPLIAPQPVAGLTLNALYGQTGRVIVFYGDDLAAQDASWDPIWPFQSGSAQREAGLRLECFDPWWRDDIGSHGGDDKPGEFQGRWLPYHIQNLKDWQADGLSGFFVTQAQMEIQPGAYLDACEDSARKNNPLNVTVFTEWMRAGVPGAQATLRPNILTLDYVEYFSLCDQIVTFFAALTPQTLATAYAHHRFDLAVVRAALHRAKPADLTTTLDPARPGKGYRLDTAHQPQWVPEANVCLAHLTPARGTVPVYRETPIHAPDSKYYFSTRSAEEAKASGWRRQGIAFHAYDQPVPGTVPIYVDTPTAHMHAVYVYTAGPLAPGWTRRGVAFHAYPFASDRAPVYVYEYKTPGYYRFSLDAHIEYTTGWTLRGAEFRALKTRPNGSTTVFEQFPIRSEPADKPRYSYSTESAERAEKNGWNQTGPAFHGYLAAADASVPVHDETQTVGAVKRHYYSPRDASEVPAGWVQAGTGFYAYPYRYG